MAEAPYNGPWQQIRPTILQRDHWICQIRLPGCTGTATDVDHIIPYSAGGAPYDPNNLRAACSKCNGQRAKNTKAATSKLAKQLRNHLTPPPKQW